MAAFRALTSYTGRSIRSVNTVTHRGYQSFCGPKLIIECNILAVAAVLLLLVSAARHQTVHALVTALIYHSTSIF
jgi:hypothetical protein